jgi:hypothetical protein
MIATLSAYAMTTDVAALHEGVFAEEGARREQCNAIVPVRTRWRCSPRCQRTGMGTGANRRIPES